MTDRTGDPMPPRPFHLEGLPEPAQLHAGLATHHSLDWGDPVPSLKDIARDFGADRARRSLSMLVQAAKVEAPITDDFLASVRPGTGAYQLESRMKSPQSLARKLRKLEGSQFAGQPLEDILRYTVVAPEPDQVVDTTVGLCEQLRAKGWAMDSAHHSYVDGSRYKGLHMFLRSQGELVELQVHSQESLDIKTRTTPLYLIERDPRQDRAHRDLARKACVELSAQLRQPAGLDELTTLGGVAVATRTYGMKRRQPVTRPSADQAPSTAITAPDRRSTQTIQQNGISKNDTAFPGH
jgi:hypothetical protein